MAIRILRKFEIKCDKCGKIIGKFMAFANGVENDLLSNLIVCCTECSRKPFSVEEVNKNN